jgi:multiple sugar transport system substrate-binding protein
MSKRSWIKGVLALAIGPALWAPAAAQEVTFTVLSHKVHENVARGLVPGTTGGDIAGEWARRKGVKLNWVTANIEPMHDRLFRELSLRETSIDVAFVINKFTVPKVSRLLEPLDPWQAKSPIEGFDGIPANLLAGVRANNVLTGIPFRHATTGLHWNTEIFKERGLDRPPRNADEVIEFARKLSFTRADGTRVSGLVANSGDEHLAVLSILNMFGAELIDKNMKVRADSPEMVKGLTRLAELYKEGVLPKNYASITIDEVISAVQQGRAAMAVDPFARYTVYNNPKSARHPGAMQVIAIPADPARKFTAMTEIWSMVIPKNAKHKDLAWDFVRELSSRTNTTLIALNGNGPVRPAAYADDRLKKQLPYTVEEAKALEVALIVPSGFDASLEALAVFREESQAAVIGLKSPQEAASAMQRRIEPLVRR